MQSCKDPSMSLTLHTPLKYWGYSRAAELSICIRIKHGRMRESLWHFSSHGQCRNQWQTSVSRHSCISQNKCKLLIKCVSWKWGYGKSHPGFHFHFHFQNVLFCSYFVLHVEFLGCPVEMSLLWFIKISQIQ